MKEFWKTWQFWVAVASVLLIIAGVVVYLCVPEFKEFINSVLITCGVCAACFGIGYLIVDIRKWHV